MAYNFEELGDERFQHLCQAVLARCFPEIQCLPVGQPDGGRDAFVRRLTRTRIADSLIFQVKFVRDSNSRDARDLIEAVINSEKKKINQLIRRGATSYYLLTNVKGSSHLGTGSIDKVNELLSSSFSIPSYCWWRDDIERKIDSFSDIKWSYPDIIRATDLLQILLSDNSEDRGATRRREALQAYLAYQYSMDSNLKFKQIDFQTTILDMFVDVPAQVVMPPSEDAKARWKDTLNPRLYSLLRHRSPSSYGMDDVEVPGAALLLTNPDIANAFPRIVIEGAPGQGKSTVTQYVCQIHRMLLLRRSELDRVPKERLPGQARIPFRVDLRDYASWLSGRDPFSDDLSARLPSDSTPVLESFLAAQVHRYTGRSFSVDDLAAIARSSQLLVMLDGFDEVADIPTRNRLVAEISDAATRLEVSAKSLQIVVTSRPAAFANSPGFPREEWQHIEILALSRTAIDNYTKKWLEARGADTHERRQITAVLKDKLGQPHVRDLARNPMQLAILLTLISVQGTSLPDKRTSLYDRYIDIYFDRECEKSKIVRDYRPLLIQVHRFLAWNLQVEAEGNSGSGNISEPRLRDLLRWYLSNEGHETHLVDDLFTGLSERVGALVSRVQGTYEFEVQPLREYFAAKYLYGTAPYSTAGSPCPGTKPERFDAIASNFYWLNVARFYAGCYDSGELASLLHCLEELKSKTEFQYIGHVSRLGITLLSDYVFSQSPKLVARLVDRIAEANSFRVLLATSSRTFGGEKLQLPPECGGLRLAEVTRAQLAKRPQLDTAYALADTISDNQSSDEIIAYWYNIRTLFHDDELWLTLGTVMGVVRRLSTTECVSLVEEIGDDASMLLFFFGRGDVFEEIPDLGKRVFAKLLQSAERYPYGVRGRTERRSRGGDVISLISWGYSILSGLPFRELQECPEHLPIRDVIRRWQSGSPTSLKDVKRFNSENLPIPRQFLGILNHALGIEVRAWKSQLEPWSGLIEPARQIWGEQIVFLLTAISAAGQVDLKIGRECRLTD